LFNIHEIPNNKLKMKFELNEVNRLMVMFRKQRFQKDYARKY